MSKPYKDFEPRWITDAPAEKSFRSIMKWGDPARYKAPKEGLYKLIKKQFNLTDDDFKEMVDTGEQICDVHVESALTSEQIQAITDIVGKEKASTDDFERVRLAYGKTMIDIMRLRKGIVENVPDIVVYPSTSDEIEALVKYADQNGIEVPVINVPGCPANPEWLVAVLVDVVMMNKLPELDSMNRPTVIFGQTIHDNCERRGHFENGEFVYEIGSKEEELGYCLYPLGCRGPQTYADCSVTLWNHGRSWCVKSGAPCIGCCEANPANPGQNWVEVNTPFRNRHRDLRVGPLVFQPGTVALGITALLGAALVVHSFGMKKTGRTDGGAPFEKIRRWDEKNPDKAIGKYEDIDAVIAEVQRDRELEAKNKAVQAERKEAAKVSGAKAQADAKALDEIAQARIAQRNAEQAAAAKESADVEGGQE